MDCEFCYDPATLTVLFPKGREVYICKDIHCVCRLAEIAKDYDELHVYSIEELPTLLLKVED